MKSCVMIADGTATNITLVGETICCHSVKKWENAR